MNLYKLIWNIVRSVMEGSTAAFLRLLTLFVATVIAALVVVSVLHLRLG
ncbi:hypothetical protein [Labedaea rhizosphaerae]|nr:hypothetical protein [Labedaea rhizosphaerae]